MTEEQGKLLQGFRIRMQQLMYLCDSLKEQNLQLKEELKNAQEQTDRLQESLRHMHAKYDNLRVIKQLESGAGEIADGGHSGLAKERLMKMVREIDKCIALLKE